MNFARGVNWRKPENRKLGFNYCYHSWSFWKLIPPCPDHWLGLVLPVNSAGCFFLVHHRLEANHIHDATDVKETLDAAVKSTGVNHIQVRHRLRLLSDNGPCYLSGELKSYLEKQGMAHTKGAPYHPMTQGKIERYYRSMKNVVKLQNYYFPWELEQKLSRFVDYYNNHRYHESLNNVIPANVYFSRHREILTKRDHIKRKTLALRRKQNLKIRVA